MHNEDAPRDAGPDREWATKMTQSSRAAPVTPAAALCHPLSRGVGVVRVAARVLSSMKRIWLSSRSLWLSPYRYLPLDAVEDVGASAAVEAALCGTACQRCRPRGSPGPGDLVRVQIRAEAHVGPHLEHGAGAAEMGARPLARQALRFILSQIRIDDTTCRAWLARQASGSRRWRRCQKQLSCIVGHPGWWFRADGGHLCMVRKTRGARIM